MKRLHPIILLALFVAILPATSFAQDQDLSRAYKKEFAYLQAQKKALQERIEQIENETKSKVGAAQAEVDRLQGRLVSLTQRADNFEDELGDAQQETTMVQDRSDTLFNTYEQARASLQQYDVEIPEPASDKMIAAEEMRNAFQSANEVIERGNQMRKSEGEFFLRDGSQVEGTVIEVGRIAA